MVTRRRFLQYGVGAGAALTLPWTATPTLAAATGPNQYSFTQREIARQLHPELLPTPLWAYDDGSGLAGQAGSFGMAVVAQSGVPLTVRYRHELPVEYPDWLPVDT